MKLKDTLTLILLGVVVFLASCSKDKACSTLDDRIVGEWEGVIKYTLLKDDVVSDMSNRDALVIFNADYSGEANEYLRVPPPFVSEGYIDTVYINFRFSYLPDAQILELVELSSNEDETLQSDFTKVYDVREHTATSLNLFYSQKSVDTSGAFRERIYEWEMTRK
jgi:hypothetical protein